MGLLHHTGPCVQLFEELPASFPKQNRDTLLHSHQEYVRIPFLYKLPDTCIVSLLEVMVVGVTWDLTVL